MTEPTIDRMSRELETARRWACAMAERVWQLEDAIRRHHREVNPDGRRHFGMSMDRELWDVLEADDV